MQYGKTLDDYVKILLEGNSGDYANSWLFGDTNTNEIMRIELGLKYSNIERTKNGFFIGFNAPYDPKIRNLECGNSGMYDIRRHQGARLVRLNDLMDKHKGKINIAVAKEIIADHYDVYLKKEDNPCARCVCSHYELDAREYMSDPSRPKPFQPRGALDGNVIDSKLKPSSDTLTHLEIYKGFSAVGGIVHTHSPWATIWAQACKSIPVLGTTHSDHFNGDVPCLPYLNKDKVGSAYEKETGIQIVEYFKKHQLEAIHMPGCLLSGHASFTWGKNSQIAFENAVALEACANMAYHSLSINSKIEFPNYILEKHFSRKHGANAYYGQK
jgi:L-ribulose-5-phosphate 4-epimerase